MKKYDIVSINEIGTRPTQQDSVGYDVSSHKGCAFAVLADGMGGLKYGDEISSLIVCQGLKRYRELVQIEDVNYASAFVEGLNAEVNGLLSQKEGMGGSTYIGVYLNKRCMQYASVGDSKLYRIRKREGIQRINVDHNFGRELDELALLGKISLYEAMKNTQRNALTSYMGAESVRLIDASDERIELKRGEVILLLSDGVSSALSEDEIARCFAGRNMKKNAELLSRCISEKNLKNQDNYSAIAIRIR